MADVAVLYPVTTIQANWFAGAEFGAAAADAANTAYSLARSVYEAGIDLDFIDHESLAGARVEDGRLKVSGLEFRVLLLPPLTTVRTATPGQGAGVLGGRRHSHRLSRPARRLGGTGPRRSGRTRHP